MGWADERASIEGRFRTQWDLSSKSSVPIRYEGSPISPGDNAEFVALFIRNANGTQITLGSNPRDRYTGVILVQIFVLERTGTQEAKEIADVVEGIFKRAVFSSGSGGTITCRIATTTFVGQDNGKHQLDVSIPFQRDEN